VANIDLAPTILDATGAVPRRRLDGRSLLELVADKSAWWGRDLLIENGRGANNVPAYRALRTNRFLYAEHRTTGEFELYDLENDPYQLRSRDGHPRYEAVQRDLARRLRLLKNCAGSGCQKRPALRLGLRSNGRAVRPGGCPAGDLRVRIRGRDERDVVGAHFRLGRRLVKRIAAPGPISQRLRRPRIGLGRRYVLRVRTELRDGRLFTLDRRLRGCPSR
jgi:hypothetical protein